MQERKKTGKLKYTTLKFRQNAERFLEKNVNKMNLSQYITDNHKKALHGGEG